MDFLSLLDRYFEFFSRPTVLLTILIVAGPFLLERFKNKVLAKGPNHVAIQDCFRLGLSKRSNLHDQYERRTRNANTNSDSSNPRIKALFTYPIKSCRGVELGASEVGSSGLKYDRLFSLAQLVTKDKAKTSNGTDLADVSSDWKHEWRFITQREFPRLALLQTELWVPNPKVSKRAEANGPPKEEATNSSSENDSWTANGGCLILRFPFEPDFKPFGLRTETVTIRIPLTPTAERAKTKQYSYEPLSIWKDCPTAINVSNEVLLESLAKLKYFLGVSNPLALFRVNETNKRAVTRSLPKDRLGETYSVGFADAFPLHMLNITSVKAVDDEISDKATAVKGKLDAIRFRANIYITGAPAHEEDTWQRITIGRCVNNIEGQMVETDGNYHIACRTARCKLPNVNPDTGEKDVNEPYTTLGRTRKVDKGAYPHPCLGMQVIPLFQQGMLKVGDEIQVLERGEHCYEKMFK